MVLTSPIAPSLYDSPQSAYAELTANLQVGERFVQAFEYSVQELPTLVGDRYLEDLFPNSPVLSSDKDLDPWEIGQGSLAICGSIATLCAFAAISRDLPIALENAIYPTERSPFGLYLVRILDPVNPKAYKWIAIDSKMPVNSSGKLTFCTVADGQAFVQCLLLKAMASARGGTFDAITNSQLWNISFPGWFPFVEKYTNSFTEYKQAEQQGCLASFTFAQQYDASGVKIAPPGIFYAHAYSLTGCIEVPGHQLVRVENPHGVAKNLATAYGDTSSFWTEHPELAQKQTEIKPNAGAWWMAWTDLILMASSNRVRLKTWTGETI